MARRAAKKKIVAFKVEEELAEFLDKLENKSDFIRKAILAQFNMACPFCTGSGVVPRGLHDHYANVIAKHNTRRCDGCGNKQTLPADLNAVPETDRKRMEQFFHGGPLYCTACYSHAPSCTDCGWHITIERIAEHHKKAHSH